MTEPGRVANPWDCQFPAHMRMHIALRVIEGRSTRGHRLKVDGQLVVNDNGYSARVVSAETGEDLGQRWVGQGEDGWIVKVLP